MTGVCRVERDLDLDRSAEAMTARKAGRIKPKSVRKTASADDTARDAPEIASKASTPPKQQQKLSVRAAAEVAELKQTMLEQKSQGTVESD